MARKLKSDRVLFLTTIALASLSVLMVYSASVARAQESYGDPFLFLTKQIMWAALGVGILLFVMRLDYRAYRNPSFIWTALGAITVCLIAVYFMPAHNGARRWFGFAGLGIQPSEPAKIVAIVFIAALLERRMERINDVSYALLPIGIVVGGLVALIAFEPDLGTSVSLAIIATVMVIAAGVSYTYIAGVLLVSLPLVLGFVYMSPYRWRRMTAFLDPWKDPTDSGYQIIQSLYAVAGGGLTGRGLMEGIRKLLYLPEAHTDFIYSVIAEELGLIGATVILICFLVIAWRGIRTTLRAPDSFGAFLALGLTTMVIVQSLLNISVVLGLVPTKGIPLPFMSFGGSSLLVNFLGMGILLNVSQHAASEV